MEMFLWLLFSAFYLFQIVLSTNASQSHLCHLDESLALFKFKQTFTVKDETSSECDDELLSYPKIISWNQSLDCCLWDGVTCDDFNGHVIGIDLSCSKLSGTIQLNNSLLHLTHLQKLNLASNFILAGPSIFRDISALTSLTFLNLSNTFDGEILPGISHLSNLTKLRVLSLANVDLSSELAVNLNLSTSLVHLDLQSSGLSGEFPDQILRLPNLETLILSHSMDLSGSLPNSNWTSLRNLDLSGTNFSGKLPESISLAKSLSSLLLTNCHFFGSIPESIGNLTQLTKMDLSFNNFSGHLPSTISNLEQLNYLDLSVNNFEGEIPDVFTHLQKLTSLQLGENSFSGGFPSSVTNISELVMLDFHSNSLTGPLPETAKGLQAQKLQFLNLSNNSLNGVLSSWLFNLPSLRYLGLDHNQFTGKIYNFKSPSLFALDLSNNKLNGPFPQSISSLDKLQGLFLSSNNLSGTVEVSMFPPNIFTLDISSNSFKWSNNNSGNITFPVLTALRLSSCEMEEFPAFIRYSNYLQVLELSNNKLHGQIPDWFRSTQWDLLGILDLSHNFLSSLGQLPWKQLGYLRLRSNLFEGPLPSYICSFEGLTVLDLSDNKLSGAIPECYGNFSTELMVLDLRKNDFHGTIPTNFANNSQLRNIGLNGNQLTGPLPPTLANCEQLEILDLGNNMLTGEFPYWLENLQKLQVLILKANRFHGTVSRFSTELPFPNMHIFDLSYNEFTGILPEKLFKSFKGMINQGEKEKLQYMEMKDANYMYYQDSLTLVVKGNEMEFVRVLNVLTVIDLSSNDFEGDIPVYIGALNSLKLLNLSHNKLQGHIPSVLGDLRNLESLDLSWNKLGGKIPWQLTNISSLAVLNLSENQLVGRIPEGSQFHTFGSNSYLGNLALCGFPLKKTCEKAEASEPPPMSTGEEEDDDDSYFFSGFSWKPLIMGYGCGLSLGLAMGCIMFLTEKPEWFTGIVQRTFDSWKKTRKCD